MSKLVENGSTVSVHYKGTLNDGTEFDSSHSRGEPIQFQAGSGQMIAGFDNAVIGMSVGDKKSVTIPFAEAYGPKDEAAVQTIPKDQFPEVFEFVAGATVQGSGPNGPFMAKIVSENTADVTLDFNHPLAGEDLGFEIEIVSVG